MDKVAERATGHTPNKKISKYWNGGIKWVSLADSNKLNVPVIYDTAKNISDEGIKNSSARYLPKGTVILLRDAAVGKVTTLGENMAVSQHFVAWICGEKLHNRYLYYHLYGRMNEFQRIAVGSTIVTIGMGYFAKMRILLPPLPEQKKIAAILGKWDEGIEKLEKLITAKKALKKGLMQQLLTGKKRFKEFKGQKWKKIEFGHLVYLSKKKYDPKKSGYSLRCIELEHIKSENGQLLGHINSNQQACVKNYFQKGNVLFGKLRPYLKKYYLASFDGVCSTEIWVLQALETLCCNHFLFYLIQTSFFYQATNVTSGTKMPRSDWNYVSEIPFEVPSLEEQKKIASILNVVDNEIEILNRKLAGLKEQKKGLMQKLLTGKIRVKV